MIIKLLYDTGLRVSEICSLRVKDIDFTQGIGNVINSKRGKSRKFKINS